jgi:hypothetical protein
MKKTLIFTILVLLILAFTITAVTAATAPFNHRYQGYSPTTSYSGNSDTVTFSDKWTFQEDIAGKDKGFTLTKTSTRPIDIFEETHISDDNSYYPYSYRDTRNYYASYRYTNYARDDPTLYSSKTNSDRIVLEAFKTFQVDNQRRDIIKSRPKQSYYIRNSYPRYSYGGYGGYSGYSTGSYSRYTPSYFYY